MAIGLRTVSFGGERIIEKNGEIPSFPKIKIEVERDVTSFNSIVTAKGQARCGLPVIVKKPVGTLAMAAEVGRHPTLMPPIVSKELLDEFYKQRDELDNMYGSGSGINGGGGGGYYSAGSYYGTSYPNYSSTFANYSSIGTYIPVTYSGVGGQSKEDVEGYEESPKKKIKKEPFTLQSMPQWKKDKMRKILLETLREYKFSKKVEDMTKGFKWLMFFLGFAILLNFGKILEIIAAVAGVN